MTFLVPVAAISCSFLRIPSSSSHHSLNAGFVFFFVFCYSPNILFRAFVVLIITCLLWRGRKGVRDKEEWNVGSRNYLNVTNIIINIIVNYFIIAVIPWLTHLLPTEIPVFSHISLSSCIRGGYVTYFDKWAMSRYDMCLSQFEAFKSWGMMIPFLQLSLLFLEAVHWSEAVKSLRWPRSLLSQWMDSFPGEPPDSQQK